MLVKETAIPDVLVLKPVLHGDDRGFFMETFRASHFKERGLEFNFVQDNQSRSKKAHFVVYTFRGRGLRGSWYVFCRVKSLM